MENPNTLYIRVSPSEKPPSIKKSKRMMKQQGKTDWVHLYDPRKDAERRYRAFEAKLLKVETKIENLREKLDEYDKALEAIVFKDTPLTSR